MNVFMIIAQLCMINGNDNTKWIAKEQLACQKYYARCMKIYSSNRRLRKCILNKK